MEHIPIKGLPLQRTHNNGLSVHSSRNQSRVESQTKDEESSQTVSHHGNIVSTTNGKLTPPSISVEEAETAYDLGDLTGYKSSDDATRYFCKSCSAHIFWVPNNRDGWMVTVGVLEKFKDIFNNPCHQFIGDTRDGGLADHLRVVDGVKLPRYKDTIGSVEVPFPWKSSDVDDESQDSKDHENTANQLEGYCHCGAISFSITRPTDASLAPSAAYPDLIHRHEGSRLSTISNIRDEKWWLRPPSSPSPTKYLAGHCMCTFCRLASGSTIVSWAFIPLANIVQRDTDIQLNLSNESQRPTGLKRYIASPGEYYEFCASCGATVFSWQTGTPDLIHVAVGMLDEKGGARVEGWLEWHRDRVSYKEKAFDNSFARGLEEGLKTSAL